METPTTNPTPAEGHPVYIITATVCEDSGYKLVDMVFSIGVRFNEQEAIRDLLTLIHKQTPHGVFEDLALDGRDLMAHYRNSGSPSLGEETWWVSSDRLLWISDWGYYQIHKMSANAPLGEAWK